MSPPAIRNDRARALQGENAGIVSRSLANLIDFGVAEAAFIGLLIVVGILRFVVGLERSIVVWQPSAPVVLGLQFVLLTAVFTIGWAGAGRTLGKGILGLRVLTSSGEALTFRRALVRASLCALVPGILLFVALSGKNLGIHDHLLRTRVNYDWGR